MFFKKQKQEVVNETETLEVKPFDHIVRLCDNFAKSEQPYWQRKACSEFVHQVNKMQQIIAEQEKNGSKHQAPKR